MLRKDIRKGWIWAVSTLWAGTVLAQPVAAPHVPSRPDSHMVAQLWESAWQRQPEAAGEGAWQQAAQARQETAGSWVAGPMALEASTKTDRFNNRNGKREYEVGVAIPLWMPGERAEGHLRHVIGMIEGEETCLDIARQLAAVESAVTAAKRVLIHDHIDHCLSHDEDSVLAEMKALTKLL